MLVFQLQELGWSPFFQQHWENSGDFVPARVVEEQRAAYRVLCESGELLAELSGHFRSSVLERADLPAVGDWVAMTTRLPARATIHRVLPRLSKFSRKTAGDRTTEQIVAANINTVFLMSSLNADLNLRRIERYLSVVWNSGAQPVVLLSKSDVCEDVDGAIQAVSEVAFGVSIHAISSVNGDGFDTIGTYVTPGRTVAVLGSSGVGKSTMINRLLGRDVQEVQEIREDDSRGRHTTTARRLFVLPRGGMLIDTPGMRELQLWDTGDAVSQVFDEIEALAPGCRFRDCEHQSEPGCAVQAALADGRISTDRFESYLKLRREQAYVARKQDIFAALEERKRWKRIHKANRDRH
jgi:ribosome biogenesis GTPase